MPPAARRARVSPPRRGANRATRKRRWRRCGWAAAGCARATRRTRRAPPHGGSAASAGAAQLHARLCRPCRLCRAAAAAFAPRGRTRARASTAWRDSTRSDRPSELHRRAPALVVVAGRPIGKRVQGLAAHKSRVPTVPWPAAEVWPIWPVPRLRYAPGANEARDVVPREEHVH